MGKNATPGLLRPSSSLIHVAVFSKPVPLFFRNRRVGFRIDVSHKLPPKSWAVAHKDQNKYVSWNPSVISLFHVQEQTSLQLLLK